MSCSKDMPVGDQCSPTEQTQGQEPGPVGCPPTINWVVSAKYSRSELMPQESVLILSGITGGSKIARRAGTTSGLIV